MINTKISTCLIKSYKNANYHVFANPPFTLKIDQPSKPLKRLFDMEKQNTAAFISPCNPFGNLSPHSENLARETILIEILNQKSKKFFRGVGEDPLGKWPEELSILIMNISKNHDDLL